MLNRNPAFLGQVRLVPPGYQPPPPPPGTFGTGAGVCPPGKMPFSFADRTVCVDSGTFPIVAEGAQSGYVPPPGTPQIQPPIEYQPPTIEDIGPEMPPPVESRDDFYPYGTGQAPAGEGGCPPGQYRPTWSARCVPKGDGGFGGFGGYGGIINMGPSGGVPFTMGRAMLGRVRLVRRPY